jgi:hypothetical protein
MADAFQPPLERYQRLREAPAQYRSTRSKSAARTTLGHELGMHVQTSSAPVCTAIQAATRAFTSTALTLAIGTSQADWHSLRGCNGSGRGRLQHAWMSLRDRFRGRYVNLPMLIATPGNRPLSCYARRAMLVRRADQEYDCSYHPARLNALGYQMVITVFVVLPKGRM